MTSESFIHFADAFEVNLLRFDSLLSIRLFFSVYGHIFVKKNKLSFKKISINQTFVQVFFVHNVIVMHI